MFRLQVLLKFFDRGFVLKVLFSILFLSLVPLGEVYLFIYLTGKIGTYLLLGTASVTALFGMLLVVRGYREIVDSIMDHVREGNFPEREFSALAGLFFAGILMIIPGFITDAVGLILFMPSLRIPVGRRLLAGMKERMKEVYEYLKMID